MLTVMEQIIEMRTLSYVTASRITSYFIGELKPTAPAVMHHIGSVRFAGSGSILKRLGFTLHPSNRIISLVEINHYT